MFLPALSIRVFFREKFAPDLSEKTPFLKGFALQESKQVVTKVGSLLFFLKIWLKLYELHP